MFEQSANEISVEAMCEVLDVSASGYYASRNREMSEHDKRDVVLGEAVEREFLESRRTYGSDRVHQQLRREGVRTSRKRVTRLMQERGLRSVRARKQGKSLTRRGDHAYIVPNLLQQQRTIRSG